MSMMLPSSYFQPYKPNTGKTDNKPSDSNVHPELQTTKLPEERLDPHMIADPIIDQNVDCQSAKEQGEGSLGPKVNGPPRLGYDEYGEELSKNARVWKTYLQEASRWDADLVDGWHRSLDLILIFAALFSAISTAFVIESSKSLQPDPAVTSANTLTTISRTLFLIANNQPGFSLNLIAPEPESFVAPISAVCVNALWFLSLSLSVSVSLVAMLAKEWTRGYVAELTGQPYQQARKRQQRWDGLKEWRVPEVVTFLPSLLHLALSGLTVYLWSIHLGAAVPVLVVTGVSVVAYGVLTILPLLDEHCPYNTPLSKLIKLLPKPDLLRYLRRWMKFAVSEEPTPWQPELEEGGEEDLMDEVTSRALAWLIVSHEDTKSADIALQAIAGATAKLPMLPLYRCNAHVLLNDRVENCFVTRQATGKTYLKDRALLEAASLYDRALTSPASFQPEVNNEEEWPAWKYLQTPWDSRCLIDNGIVSVTSDPNKAAFALSSISFGPPELKVKSYIVLTNRLLQLYLKHEITLEAPALLALLRATTHWSNFDIADQDLADHIRLMITAVQFANSLNDLDITLEPHGLVGAALTAFACSRRSYSRWPLFESSDPQSQRSQADSIARHYEHSLSSAAVESLFTFGLLELLRHHTTSLSDSDLTTIFYAFLYYDPRPAVINIHTLPVHAFGSNYRYIVETAIPFLTPNSQGAYAWSEEVRSACFSVFRSRHLELNSPQAVDVYALALGALRSARSGLLKRSCCHVLAEGYHRNLINELSRRNLLPSYLEMLECEDERVAPYIMTGLTHIIGRQIGEPYHSSANQEAILQPLLSYEQSLNTAQKSGQGSRTVTIDMLIACAEAWLPRLEAMAGRIPQYVDRSDVLFWLLSWIYSCTQDGTHPLIQRCAALTSRIRQDTSTSGLPDWS
ncbi:hypothetical protein FRC12_023871 [Ceratobasidium sp. 428]|nr:hypothetical protein FRC12_023871 [Ceratobasidium sp. 428]